jgi:hypothetical protein
MKSHLFGMCQNVYHVYKLVVISGNKCIILVQDNLQYFCYKYLLMEETQLPESEQVLAAASANQPFADGSTQEAQKIQEIYEKVFIVTDFGFGHIYLLQIFLCFW